MTSAVVAIDQGTTNTKVLLVAADGAVLARASRSVATRYLADGWVEQSASAIWNSVVDAIADVVGQRPDCAIVAIGIANQRETIVVWDRATGEPLAPAIVWQCRRTSPDCARLRDRGEGDRVQATTGLGIDPLFPALKIGWLLDHLPGARVRAADGELACGTIDSWLLWNLTAGEVQATDHGNASRTQLLNIDTGMWDAPMLALFDVPEGVLPRVCASDAEFGRTAAGQTALPPGVPIRAMMGDSHAALIGHGIRAPGRAKVTCGTGSSVMTLTDGRVRSRHGLSETIAWSRSGDIQYALEGNIAVSGHAAAFATRLLGLADEQELTELARMADDGGGVVFVPALAGMGAPHWRDQARGTITGLSLASLPAHVARATFEGIALQINDVFAAMQSDLGTQLPALSVDGGAAGNGFLMQMLADVTDRAALRPPITDAGALGVALIAFEALGLAEHRAPDPSPTRFQPAMRPDDRQILLRRWNEAIGVSTVATDGSPSGGGSR